MNGDTRDRTSLLYVDKNEIVSVFPQLKTITVSTLFHILIQCDVLLLNSLIAQRYLQSAD